MCLGLAIFARMILRAHIFKLRAISWGLPSCGIFSCKGVSVTQRKEMGKEDQEGLGNVAVASKKNDEDPLPVLRKPSTIWPLFPPSRGDTHPTRKRPSSSGPMDKIFYLNFTRGARTSGPHHFILFLPQLHLIQCCIVTIVY